MLGSALGPGVGHRFRVFLDRFVRRHLESDETATTCCTTPGTPHAHEEI